MKKKFAKADISLIETKVEEEIALRAEELFDKNALNDIRALDEDWTAVVVDKNIHFNVSVSLDKGLLVHAQCNCPTYAREQICPHILTTIFAIRQKTATKSKKKKEKKVERRRRSVNINHLLDSIDREDLDQFIIAKCRADQNFKLHFQARYIDKIPSDRLAEFVESTFTVLTKANEKVAPAKLRLFLDLSDELMQHFKHLMSQDDLIEAYRLVFLVLKKSFYIKYHLKNDNARFLKAHKELLSNYQEVYLQIEAPEYKEGVDAQLIELLDTSYISANLRIEQSLWITLLSKDSLRDELSKLVDNYLSRPNNEDLHSVYFIKMLELALVSDQSTQQKLISQKDMQECYRIIQYMIEYAEIPPIKRSIITLYLSGKLNHPLAKSCLEHMEDQVGQREVLKDQSIAYFKKYKEPIYLSFIQRASDDWSRDQILIESQLEVWPDPSLLIKYYLYMEDAKSAISEIREDLTLQNIQRYDQQLCDIDEGLCQELYTDFLQEYLSHHFGVKAQDFTRTVYQRIRSIGMEHWIKPLSKHLSEQMPDRKILS